MGCCLSVCCGEQAADDDKREKLTDPDLEAQDGKLAPEVDRPSGKQGEAQTPHARARDTEEAGEQGELDSAEAEAGERRGTDAEDKSKLRRSHVLDVDDDGDAEEKGDVRVSVTAGDGGSYMRVEGPQDGTIDINTADVATLDSITGVSKAIAGRIIESRPFFSWDDLQEQVRGVGKKTVEKMQNHPGVFLGGVKIPFASPRDLGTPIVEDFPRRMTKDPELSIASWNIRHLSKNRSDDALKIIGAIISKFDIVAVQEIRDVEVLERLRDEHMSGFEFVASEEVLFGKTKTHVEHYAFFYRTELISVRSQPKIVEFKKRAKGASDQTDALDAEGPFSRSPFLGYFAAKNFEFILCTTHITWGDGSGDVHREVRLLDEVMGAVQKFVQKEKDVILLGDFNLDYYSDAGNAWQLNDMPSRLSGSHTLRWTPLVKRPNFSTYSEDRFGTHLYDQIWVSRQTHRLFTQRSGVIYFDRDVFGDSPAARKEARKLISDHRPVWAIFRDHDLDESITLDFSDMQLSDPRDRGGGSM